MNMATTTFFRLLKDPDKGAALAEAIGSVRGGRPEPRVFDVDPVSFRKVPTTPFAYWVSEHARGPVCPRYHRSRERGAAVRLDSQTSDDFRFVRAWWEVLAEKGSRRQQSCQVYPDLRPFQQWCQTANGDAKRWAPFAKGRRVLSFLRRSASCGHAPRADLLK